MKRTTIWFNKHLSNTGEALASLTDARNTGELRVICTHPQVRFSARLPCDQFETEPIGLGDETYIRHCLDFAREHRVDIFFPGRKVQPLMEAWKRFQAIGVRLVSAAAAETLALLNSKSSVYAAIAGEYVTIPDYAIVNDLASFDAAWNRLRERHTLLCYKPDVSVFGLGFHRISESLPNFSDGWTIHLDEARRRIANDSRRRTLMLMQYLPGPERSVDCLARDGELVRCVVRRKVDAGQWIEKNSAIEAAARWLTARFRLNNLFNVQFRDANGISYLLEINARMSGGLPFACQSGVAFPLWAIRLALGTATDADVPQPRTGIWVPRPAQLDVTRSQ